MRSRHHATAAILLLIIIAAWGIPNDVAGGDDGGGRSFLAYGAGIRALSMGGAFVAISDDASAALWNPGGLGSVQRQEFQATHTNLIGLGFSEQYASFVLPSWRWGVASLTYRKFGVDGIEQRDDRNFLLNDDLSDNETELALAYGRNLSSAWSIGGTLKMRRQSLAGFSDTGFGLDLGLLIRPMLAFGSNVPWAHNFSFGISARNLVEPVIRLDQENVPDPTGLRIGMAYQHEVGQLGQLLAAFDVEKTRNMDSHLHAGLEWQIHPVLGFRAGVNDGAFTAGTSIRWRDIGVDYMFEDTPNNAVHSIGVSFFIGRTVEQKRQSALAAEEDSLQARLASAFAERSQRQVLSFMHQAESAIENQEYDKALEITAMIKVLDPDLPQAQALETKILREQGLSQEQDGDYMTAAMTFSRALNLNPDDQQAQQGIARVRVEIDRQEAHSTAVRQALDAALNALATGDLVTARDGFQDVLAIDPNSTETAALLKQTEQAIKNRAASLIDYSRALVKVGQYDEAWDTLQQARVLDPNSTELQYAVAFLADSRSTQASPDPDHKEAAHDDHLSDTERVSSAGSADETSPATSTTVTAEKRQEIADLYRRGIAALEVNRVDEAVHYWELVWLTDPNYQRVSQYLKQEYLSRGMEAFVAGDLQAAISDWEKAVRVDPNDERARGYLQRAQQQQAVMENIGTGGSD